MKFHFFYRPKEIKLFNLIGLYCGIKGKWIKSVKPFTNFAKIMFVCFEFTFFIWWMVSWRQYVFDILQKLFLYFFINFCF